MRRVIWLFRWLVWFCESTAPCPYAIRDWERRKPRYAAHDRAAGGEAP